jgi:transposase-like protein
MRQQTRSLKEPAEKVVQDIRRATRKHYSAKEKIRIVLEGLRGEDSIAEVCRREGIAQNLYYRWSKDFLEAGKKRLAGDTDPGRHLGRGHRVAARGHGAQGGGCRSDPGKPSKHLFPELKYAEPRNARVQQKSPGTRYRG